MADELIYAVEKAGVRSGCQGCGIKGGAPKAFSAGGDIGYFDDLIKAAATSIWTDSSAKLERLQMA